MYTRKPQPDSKRPASLSAHPQPQPHFISGKELAQKIGVSPRTIDTWVAAKRIPCNRFSPRMTKFNLERVLAALARYEVQEIGRTGK